jgi:PEGA domain
MPLRAQATVDATDAARAEFVKGTELVRNAQWSEALAAFERSRKLHPHAVTTYNVGACERALGRYTRARKTLRAALTENDAAGGTQLAEGVTSDIKAYLAQIEGLLSTAEITLEPIEAAIAVDGRPIEQESVGVMVAGLRAPGPGEVAPSRAFKLVFDPGAHVITLSRRGYSDAVVNRTFAPGSTTKLALTLDLLPATLHISADRPGAVVTVDGTDVGVVPVDVSRAAGKYKVVVRKAGFARYDAEVTARPGESLDLRASLPPETTAITSKWWFWTAAGVVLVGAAAGTYFLTRTDPAPVRPPLNGGGLSWVVPVQ